jgi:hypothetical protein
MNVKCKGKQDDGKNCGKAAIREGKDFCHRHQVVADRNIVKRGLEPAATRAIFEACDGQLLLPLANIVHEYVPYKTSVKFLRPATPEETTLVSKRALPFRWKTLFNGKERGFIQNDRLTGDNMQTISVSDGLSRKTVTLTSENTLRQCSYANVGNTESDFMIVATGNERGPLTAALINWKDPSAKWLDLRHNEPQYGCSVMYDDPHGRALLIFNGVDWVYHYVICLRTAAILNYSFCRGNDPILTADGELWLLREYMGMVILARHEWHSSDVCVTLGRTRESPTLISVVGNDTYFSYAESTEVYVFRLEKLFGVISEEWDRGGVLTPEQKWAQADCCAVQACYHHEMNDLELELSLEKCCIRLGPSVLCIHDRLMTDTEGKNYEYAAGLLK